MITAIWYYDQRFVVRCATDVRAQVDPLGAETRAGSIGPAVARRQDSKVKEQLVC
jgi:hypothetical protein